jgi:hypothetical protein
MPLEHDPNRDTLFAICCTADITAEVILSALALVL